MDQEILGVLKSNPVTVFTGMDSEKVCENTLKYNKVPKSGEIKKKIRGLSSFEKKLEAKT